MLTAVSRYGARVHPTTQQIVAACRERGEFIRGPQVAAFEQALGRQPLVDAEDRVLVDRQLGGQRPDGGQPIARLQDAGVSVALYPASAPLYIHAKVVLADYGTAGARVFIGSENFSRASLTRNRELGLRPCSRSNGRRKRPPATTRLPKRRPRRGPARPCGRATRGWGRRGVRRARSR